ncbi:MAG: ArnT family glycosyltransferase, partial [Vicinamibacterales bacterium]
MTGQVIDASPPASQVSSRLVLVAAIYLGVHASALMLTQSGDWGMGWARLPDVLGVVPYLLAIVTTAALVVLSSTAPGTLWAGLRRLAGWRGAVAFVCLVVVGTLIRPAAREYAAGVALTATFYGLELSLVCAAPASLSAGAADSLGRWATAYRPRLPWMLAGWTIMVCLAASWIVFERIPHVPDEVAYWFQAKYFAAGHLYLASPPDAAAFELPHTIVADGKWYSIFPPGWPMVLAAGMRIGAPWLINPLLGAASVLLLHALISDMYSRSTADLSALLLASSPMFLLMSSGLMSHPLSLVLALVALLGWRLGVRRGSVIRSLMGGLALGALVLTRPIEGAIFFAVMAAWGAVERRRRTSLAVFLLVAVAAGAVTLLYNRALTGSAAYDPITKYFDERYYPGSNRLGFGADIGNTGWQNDVRAGHSPAEAVINSHRNGYLLNLELFGWGFGSLAGVALFLLYGTWTRTDRFLASVAVAVVAALGLYWYAGADYGARYWYQLVVPLVVLTARGIESFAVRARESGAPM